MFATRSRLVLAGLVGCLVTLGADVARAIEVDEVIWGFDGRACAGDFCPLSVLIQNASPEPFEGKLRLQRLNGASEPVGATIEEPVFVSPFAGRWVQFYPYIIGQSNDWALSWGRGTQRYPLRAPVVSMEPARIILEEPGNLAVRGGSMQRLPDNLFPPMVTATSALGMVVLDHAPRWEESRRRAFLDWLSRGGIVHVIHGPDGRYPEFPATLSQLETPLEVNRVGAGLVFRHPRTRSEMDQTFVDSIIRADHTLSMQQSANDSGGKPATNTNPSGPSTVSLNYTDWDSDGGLFHNLKQMTRVKHNWTLIYVMSCAYVLLLFPGCYILGRLRFDYRMTLGALLATVALFSVGFSSVGRRGYGESTAVHSVAIARPLSDGFYDVIEWTNVFVTDGDFYTVRHAGNGGLYSTCQEVEAVNALIDNGLQSQFLVDIPPYSSRTFAHRTKLKGKPILLTVEKWDAGETLQQLVVSTGGNFPETTQQIYALYRDRFYTLSREKGRLELQTNVGAPVSGFLRLDEYDEFRRRVSPFFNRGDDRTPEQRFHALLKPLAGRSLQLRDAKTINEFSLPGDRIRLFVYAPMTDEFFVRGERFGSQAGYVLYCFDLFDPEVL